MRDFETRKNFSRRIIISNSPKTKIKVGKKCNYPDHYIFKDKQI